MGKVKPLKPDQLRWECPPETFSFGCTEELATPTRIFGQPRAMAAIDFGVGIQSEGYNIYALGPAGIGKETAIRLSLEEKARAGSTPSDWCYVYNFDVPHQARAIRLPPGRGCALKRDMEELIEDARKELTRAFESDEFDHKRNEVTEAFNERRKQELQQLERVAREQSFILQSGPSGPVLVPVINGRPLGPDQFERLSEPERERFNQAFEQLNEALLATMRRVRQQEKETKRHLQDLEKEVAREAIVHLIEELREQYPGKEVDEYLEAVLQDIIAHVQDFLSDQQQGQMAPAQQQTLPAMNPSQMSVLNRYKVNVLVDNQNQQGAPVIVASNPTYHNLVGRVEHLVQFGMLTTDFTMIKAGALHRANGGYLVIEMAELLKDPFAYDALKRALKNHRIKIEELGERFRVIATTTLDPKPIPLNVKVVLLGNAEIYHLLQRFDDDFQQLFKVKADFDLFMERTNESIENYAHFICQRCNEEQLPHFDPSGVAKVVEYGVRLADHQNKLATRFADIADIVREAGFWARQNGHALVTGEDVKMTIDQKMYRSNRIEKLVQQMIAEGTIMVDTEGEVVGQVNGLSIAAMGDYVFGKPSRITARTFLGRGGVINIEREVKLSGPIHDKGVLILSSFLGNCYGQNKPLTLSASICFEQLYEGVEGDSASSTELYAILSSLSGLPIRQGIAVTGSVNQKGEIQPIGGINKKIEGFFDVCKARGLNGDQGVMMPVQNVSNLMLREDVVEAVSKGLFHIYAVSTVDEGIEILTGTAAGERDADGEYPEGTVNALVDAKLEEMAESMQRFGGEKPYRNGEEKGTRDEA